LRGVQEMLHLFARQLVGLGGPLAEQVHAAMNVRVVLA
jgi:hypothetical protein